MATRLAEHPGGTITKAFRTSAERQGAYGLLEDERVLAESLIDAAGEACARRCATEPLVLVSVDGTSATLTDTDGHKGFGPVGPYRLRVRGLKVLSAIALRPDGTPLGLCAQRLWMQPPAGTARRSRRICDALRVEQKQTQHWIDVIKATAARLGEQAPTTRCWFQLDREGDAWPILQTLVKLAPDRFTVRARNRRVRCARSRSRLRQVLARQPVLGGSMVQVPATLKRPGRRAHLTLRAARVVLVLRNRRTKWRWPLELYAVWAHEVGTTPRGEAPLDWMPGRCSMVLRGRESAMRGSDFMRSLPAGGDARSVQAREQLVLEAVKSGLALPIVWAPLTTHAGGHTGTIYVATDTLRFGVPGPNADPSDWDWVRVAVTADTAQRIADTLGVLLPTDRIADLAHAQADVRLTPHPQTPVTATTEAMLKHHAAIEAERAGREGLLSTIGKDWILGPELFPAASPAHPLGKDGALNYGWHTIGPVTSVGPYQGCPGVILWQQRGFRHNRRHVDYSQWVPRFVHPRVRVDGRDVSTAEVMMSPEFAGLVSYQGPLLGARYPLPTGPVLNQSSMSSTASSSMHETSSPVDAEGTASRFDPFADLWRKAMWGR